MVSIESMVSVKPDFYVYASAGISYTFELYKQM